LLRKQIRKRTARPPDHQAAPGDRQGQSGGTGRAGSRGGAGAEPRHPARRQRPGLPRRTPYGERLSQTNTSDGTTSYYSYNDHSDVQAVTNASTGNTTATYGYTAYGQPIASQWTGADKNNTTPDPTKTTFNAYRYNAMRWDSSSGQYDMGFRNYSANLNQFLSRDMYNGALGDMSLATDPFTGNRYTYGAGNPISNTDALPA
jgi:RHS repeat-associated protein